MFLKIIIYFISIDTNEKHAIVFEDLATLGCWGCYTFINVDYGLQILFSSDKSLSFASIFDHNNQILNFIRNLIR